MPDKLPCQHGHPTGTAHRIIPLRPPRVLTGTVSQISQRLGRVYVCVHVVHTSFEYRSIASPDTLPDVRIRLIYRCCQCYICPFLSFICFFSASISLSTAASLATAAPRMSRSLSTFSYVLSTNFASNRIRGVDSEGRLEKRDESTPRTWPVESEIAGAGVDLLFLDDWGNHMSLCDGG